MATDYLKLLTQSAELAGEMPERLPLVFAPPRERNRACQIRHTPAMQ